MKRNFLEIIISVSNKSLYIYISRLEIREICSSKVLFMEFWVVYWFGYTYIHILRKTWKAKTLVHFSTNSNCLKGYWHFQNGPYSLNKSGDLQQLKTTTRKVVKYTPGNMGFWAISTAVISANQIQKNSILIFMRRSWKSSL